LILVIEVDGLSVFVDLELVVLVDRSFGTFDAVVQSESWGRTWGGLRSISKGKKEKP
jgi:hypothetical protein